jgi:hypothetical protein
VGKEIECPEKRDRRGLVTGNDHRRDLVTQLLACEGGACLGVARSAQQVEKVARRAALI